MEPKGIQIFEARFNTTVKKTGLVISKQYPYLGASPDGIAYVNNEEVLFECKWVAQKKCKEAKLDECVRNMKHFCLEMDGTSYKLKRKHPYYY